MFYSSRTKLLKIQRSKLKMMRNSNPNQSHTVHNNPKKDVVDSNDQANTNREFVTS